MLKARFHTLAKVSSNTPAAETSCKCVSKYMYVKYVRPILPVKYRISYFKRKLKKKQHTKFYIILVVLIPVRFLSKDNPGVMMDNISVNLSSA